MNLQLLNTLWWCIILYGLHQFLIRMKTLWDYYMTQVLNLLPNKLALT